MVNNLAIRSGEMFFPLQQRLEGDQRACWSVSMEKSEAPEGRSSPM